MSELGEGLTLQHSTAPVSLYLLHSEGEHTRTPLYYNTTLRQGEGRGGLPERDRVTEQERGNEREKEKRQSERYREEK